MFALTLNTVALRETWRKLPPAICFSQSRKDAKVRKEERTLESKIQNLKSKIEIAAFRSVKPMLGCA